MTNAKKEARDPMICVGKVLGAHGVKGLAKVASFTATPEDIAAYGALSNAAGSKEWTIKLQGWHKDHFLAQLSGVDTRETAEALRGTLLYIPRSKLPDTATGAEEFYYADLIGLKAILEDGTAYGIVKNILNYGASDILDIRRENGERALIAFTKVNVPIIDIQGGALTLNPPLMEDDENEADEIGDAEIGDDCQTDSKTTSRGGEDLS